VPESQVPVILDFLQAYRNRHDQPSAVAEVLRPTVIKRTVRRPLFGSKIQAGFPSPADDYVAEQLDLHELLVKREAATFYVKVKGDSMAGAGIQEGDILVVDRSVEPADGKIVIAVLNGELTVKELSRKKDHIQLLPRNDAYPPIDISSESDLVIWGVVTGVVRQL
jgi:DNA polymerase V